MPPRCDTKEDRNKKWPIGLTRTSLAASYIATLHGGAAGLDAEVGLASPVASHVCSLKIHSQTLWARGFLSKKVWTKAGLIDLPRRKARPCTRMTQYSTRRTTI